jgi:predicted molibdopterin-dependent oxidoreductase YjgC
VTIDGFVVRVDGTEVTAYAGDTVASVLMRSGHVAWRRTRHGDRPRGLFCGMGACQDCLVRVDAVDGVRACLAPAEPGMSVVTSERGDG